MKKISIILSLALLIGVLSAIDFTFDGELRQRAALANDEYEADGGWLDSRLLLGLESQLHQDLSIRLGTQIGDIVWGNGAGGISTGASLSIQEALLKYNINALDAKITVGQQYWMDKMGLLMDDYFSGIKLEKEDFFGLNTELIWMKSYEGNPYSNNDEDIFVLHGNMEESIPMGLYAIYGNYRDMDYSNISLYPYLSLDLAPIALDIAPFLDLQLYDGDNEFGFGAAVKAKMDLDVLELGADILFAGENGITTISPWYQNGLYIYGIGKHHDGTNLYWGAPYSGNADTFFSGVISAKFPVNESLAIFGAAGYLMDLGAEINAGIEYELIPDLLNLNVFGAFGNHDNDTNNYLFGSSLKMEF